MRKFLVLLILFWAATANATVTIHNFITTGIGQAPVVRFHTEGSAIDLHDGGIYQWAPNGTLYWYGTMYGCGYLLMSPLGHKACGFGVSTSPDGKNWTKPTLLFPIDVNFQNVLCQIGCFRAHVLYNDISQKYVLFYNASFVGNGLKIYTSDFPDRGFVDAGTSPTIQGAALLNDLNVFKDDNGTAYLIYAAVSGGVNVGIKLETLNSAYTNTTGAAATTIEGDASGNYEGMMMFKRGSTYYVVYGPGCGYCNSTPTIYRTASTPTGTWSGTTQINATSCGGQPTHVSKLTLNSADVYLFQSDQWVSPESPPGRTRFGFANQARAGQFWLPLSFTGTAINTFTCANSFTLDTTDSNPLPPFPDADQTTGFSMSYFCGSGGAGNSLRYFQSFTPSRTGVHTVKVLTAQGPGQDSDACGGSAGSSGTCTVPNAPLVIDLVNVNASTHLPTPTIASVTVTQSTMS